MFEWEIKLDKRNKVNGGQGRVDRRGYRAEYRRETRINDFSSRPFVAWDSEGSNADRAIFLLGSSEGDRLAHQRLGTVEIFECLLRAEARNPNVWHIMYGAEYDFNMFLIDLPESALLRLRDKGRVYWGDYRIRHTPNKFFSVSRLSDGKTGPKVTLYDIVTFFSSKYLEALIKNGIGTPEQWEAIGKGKDNRENFTYDDLSDIEPYMYLELELMPLLANRLRDNLYGAGMHITKWYGPGAIASYVLKEQGVKECMKESPDEVLDAARYAYCGGRFQTFKAGFYDGPVYTADINSAYPYSMTKLPDLTTGWWEHVEKVDATKIDKNQFALYHLRFNYTLEPFSNPPFPLFYRRANALILYPFRTTGWYWAPEVATLPLAEDKCTVEFIEAWVYHDDGTRPFSYINELYSKRRVLQAAKDPIEMAYKLALNSTYGKMAQRVGYQLYKSDKYPKGGPPRFHQLEWAGYVTSYCRSMVYETALQAWKDSGLLAIATDAVFSTTPLDDTCLENGSGQALGQWSTKQLDGILLWQSGVYFTRGSDKEWHMEKARGMKKTDIDFRDAMKALENPLDIPDAPAIFNTIIPLPYYSSMFVKYRRALRQNDMEHWREFVTTEESLAFGGAPWSKASHWARLCLLCRAIQSGETTNAVGLHGMAITSVGGGSEYPHSHRHSLLWMDNDTVGEIDPIDIQQEMDLDGYDRG